MDSVTGLLAALRPWPDLPSPDGRVILRPWRVEDADFLIASYADVEARTQTPLIEPINLDIASRWIRDHASRGLHPAAPAFLIIDTHDERAGAIGATNIDWRLKRAEFFYWVLEPYRGHGLATSALRTISNWALNHGLTRLELMIDLHNQTSTRVALAAGYNFERVHFGYRFLNDKLIDAAAYVQTA
jgi:RimJ/RimL family protein N-acetyltransferase